MEEYTALLNRLAEERTIAGPSDLDDVERFWIQRVEDFFAGKPFKVRSDPSKGLRAIIRDVVAQAEARRSEASGMMITGAVLQHLVGAKLELAVAGGLEHHSFSTSDQQTRRAGDFVVGSAALHVTVTPSEAVIQRCQDNLEAGLRPIIVTTKRGVAAAEVLAENQGIEERLDIFEVEQFIALNLYELSGFKADERKATIAEFVQRYNAIVDDVETDPSLKIENQ